MQLVSLCSNIVNLESEIETDMACPKTKPSCFAFRFWRDFFNKAVDFDQAVWPKICSGGICEEVLQKKMIKLQRLVIL